MSYIVVMSSGPVVPIEADEVKSVMQGIQSGSVVRVRQGIINPSHVVSVVEDKARQPEKFKTLDTTKHQMVDMVRQPQPLRDIFAQLKALPAGKKP